MSNQILYLPGTPIVFTDSGGDADITLANLGFGAGRVSAQYDRGAGAKPLVYEWRAVIQFETAPTIGEVVEIYLFESDGTYIVGNVGTSDAALTADKRRNAKPLKPVIADTTSTATNIIASGVCEIYSRYFSVGIWNASVADNLENTAGANRIIFTPVIQEVQDAA